MLEADHSVLTGPVMGEFFELVKDVFGGMNVGHDHAKNVKMVLQEEGIQDIKNVSSVSQSDRRTQVKIWQGAVRWLL